MASLDIRILLNLSLIAVALAYDLGKSHIYQYETTTAINEECGDAKQSDMVGHSVKATVELSVIWQDPQNSEQKLMKIQVLEYKLFVSTKTSFEERKGDFGKTSLMEFFVLLKNNRVETVWDSPKEHPFWRNFKRSVASLLQVSGKDGEEKLKDVSGDCDVVYKFEGNTIRRGKRRCRHPIEDSVLSQPPGVRSSTVQHSAAIDCDKKDSIILKCLVNEYAKTFSNLWQKASICVQSTSSFIFAKTSEVKEVFKTGDYNNVIEKIGKHGELKKGGNLYAVAENKEEPSSSNIGASTKSFQESLKTTHVAKLKSASAFFKLLPIYRSAAKDDILKVLENKKFAAILPQILDLVAASSTPSSLKAALNFFGKVKDYDENFERFLISLSVLPRPEVFTLNEIQDVLKKGHHHEKIEAVLVNTLGALVNTYSKSEKANFKIVEDVTIYLEEALKKCKNEDCILTHLRGLRNAAQTRSKTLLFQFALKGGKPALEALLALRNIPTLNISDKEQTFLQNIYKEIGVKQDRSVRAIAAEILLKVNPSDDVLRNVLGTLSDQSDEEFSTFVVSKVLHLMDKDKELRSRILKVLAEKDVAHYYSLSQKGKSSLFKRQLMSTEGLNATYGIEMELLAGGLLKRSSFDVELETKNDVSNLLSVGMFASGMGSFVGESTSEDEGDPTAGMELTLLGASLRPYIFFTSTSEVMGHAWSGTASELTPALQGVFSLSDDNQVVVLHNGMVARLELRGAMSTDLSASIQLSIWNRNAQSQVKTAAALLVKGAAIVDTPFAVARGEYLYYGSSAIDFNSDFEFAESPYKMCFQMEHPNAVVRHDFQRSVEEPETKFSLKKTKKRKRFIPGRSYALHQINNELCRIMKDSQDY